VLLLPWNYKTNTETCCGLTSYVKSRVITMLSIPTIWRRDVVTIDMVVIMTSSHLMYNKLYVRVIF